MRDINLEVYFWREAIADYIKENYTETFVQWYDFLFKELSGERKREFIFLLNAVFNRYISIGDLHKWFICFFDKEEKGIWIAILCSVCEFTATSPPFSINATFAPSLTISFKAR